MAIVDDELFRDRNRARTMDVRVLRRTEAVVGRAIRSDYYYKLIKWVDKMAVRRQEESVPAPESREEELEAKKGPSASDDTAT